jgi:FHA domain
MRAKPTGVLVIAMFYLLSGGASLAVTLWLLMASADTSRLPFGGGEVAKYVLWLALITAAIGAGYLATALGLWELKQWAQAAAIAAAGLALLCDLISVLMLSFGGGLVPIQLYVLEGLYAAVSLGIVAYLLTPATSRVFASSEALYAEVSCPHCLREGILPGMSVCPFCQVPLSRFAIESSLPSVADLGRTSSVAGIEPAGPLSAPATTRVSPPTAPVRGWLIVKSGSDAGKCIDLGDDVEIGRDVNSGVKLRDDYVSRQHARVKLEGSQFFIYDAGSRGGTFVNGRQVQRLMLYDGAEIRLGNTTLEFKRTHTRVGF